MAVKEITNTGQAKSSLLLPTSAGWTQICDSVSVGASATFDTNTILGGNIPGVYRHLKALVTGRSNGAVFQDALIVRFNNDTGSNYDQSGATNTALFAAGIVFPGASDTAGTARPGALSFEVLDYANAVMWKQAMGLNQSHASSGSQVVQLVDGEWRSTAAITRISIALTTGTTFITGSRFTLYGM